MLLIATAGFADSRAQKYYYEDIAHPFFAIDPSHPGMYRNQRPASKAALFPAVKPENGFRVFVIGGSIAGLLQESASSEFEKMLSAVLPKKKVEVINCGMAGYETFREALIEQEILAYSPDLIVMLTGHNEGIASAPIPIWIMRTQERLSRLSAYRALIKTLRPEETAAGPKHSDAVADARDGIFARNLAENLRHAREQGVPVAVVVPPRNYRAPVELSRSPYDAQFLPGWLRYLQGDYAGARRSWKTILLSKGPQGSADSESKAFTWGFIARSEENLGLLAEARASFDRAAVFDRAAICGAVCQDIIRRVTENEGGFLIEADRMFRALAYPRMPGMETFNDRMHWKPQYNCLMSSEIIATLRVNPRFSAFAWNDARIRALKSACVKPGGHASEDDDRRILSYVLMGLSWPDFSHLSSITVFYLEALARHRPDWFKDVPALMKMTENPQTQVYGLSMAPDSLILPRFYWHIGEVRLLKKDYSGAAEYIATALKLDPKLSWARLSLAVAVTLSGDKKRGFELLQEAVARTNDDQRHEAIRAAAIAVGKAFGLEGAEDVAASDPDFWIKKAGTAIAARKKDEGMAALARARAMSPRPHQLRSIAQYYFLLHEPGAFLELSDALLAAYPRDVDLWLSRAEALFAKGRSGDCRVALTRAEALSPNASQLKQIARWRERLVSRTAAGVQRK